MERVDAIIAGVNKAGTTSLFVSLSEHPDVVPSAVKESRYFLPARYGHPLEPVSAWDALFAAADRPVRLEATPSYFYGGSDVANAMQMTLTNPKIVLVLREPVARAISFFEYQKIRLRLPQDLGIEAYLASADALADADFANPDNEKYMAVRGGRYADWLPEWWEVLGRDGVKIVWFDDLVADGAAVLHDVATWLGLEPDRLSDAGLRSENRTTPFRNARLQRLALAFNDGSERILRRVPGVKRRLRSWYFALNGRSKEPGAVPDSVWAGLAERFVEPNQRLGALLDDAGLARPAWLGS
ncbi:MAG: sulfotransferase domain-containing protein [Acidimicrobiia bacterium]|nr:sulfotransferase domain-containing protein [Acidimicrobiia bacterium]